MLKLIYDSVDEIPENYRDLYTEKNGKWHFTAIAGIKTQDDITSIQGALDNEKAAHAETKSKLAKWNDLDPEETHQKLDRIPELEAAAQGTLDQHKIDEIVNNRVEGTISSRLAPLERQVKNLTDENATLTDENATLKGAATQRTVQDDVRAAMTKLKVIPEAYDDVLMYGDKLFQVQEDGAVVTRDGVGVTPGIAPEVWLQEVQTAKPHWWPPSTGGGAPGGKHQGGFANNPWSAEHWNRTAQAQMIRDDRQKAEQMAKSAGVDLMNAQQPKPKS